MIANYRSPQPTVRESAVAGSCATALARAICDAAERCQLRAMLRYCDGHLHRINGEARKARRQIAEAQREFAEAVAAFREAAELRPDWPDPFLGLARTFIYGLDDVDRGGGCAAARRACRLRAGAPRSRAARRRLSRARGETLARSARDVVGLTQEREYLTRAAELYRQALDQYARAADYEGVAENIALAQRSAEHRRSAASRRSSATPSDAARSSRGD